MNKFSLLLLSLTLALSSFSQTGTLIDGTIGVVGDKVILHSEIEEQLVQARLPIR